MTAHLWTHEPAPWEYIELILCRDVYHCTPQELDQIPAERLLAHLTCMAAERLVQEAKERQGRRGT